MMFVLLLCVKHVLETLREHVSQHFVWENKSGVKWILFWNVWAEVLLQTVCVSLDVSRCVVPADMGLVYSEVRRQTVGFLSLIFINHPQHWSHDFIDYYFIDFHFRFVWLISSQVKIRFTPIRSDLTRDTYTDNIQVTQWLVLE